MDSDTTKEPTMKTTTSATRRKNDRRDCGAGDTGGNECWPLRSCIDISTLARCVDTSGATTGSSRRVPVVVTVNWRPGDSSETEEKT